MAEFRLERFKYTWKGDWASNVSYKRDDVVRLNGVSYVCVVTHTSNDTFRTDLNAILPGSNPPIPEPRWVIMTGGKYFASTYTSGVNYNLGDVVLYNGVLWLCVVPHQASDFTQDRPNFEVFANGIEFLGEWAQNTVYSTGGIVAYGGILYKCITPHRSSVLLEANQDSWEIFYDGIEYKGNWTSFTLYKKNDLVKYGGTIFRCIETHTSNETNLNDDYFQIEFLGTQFNQEWDSTVYYNVGDVVRHKGFTYYAIQNNFNSSPYQEGADQINNWILLSRSSYFAGNWAITNEYKTGDIVSRGGNLYMALRDIGANTQDGSSADYLDSTIWELLVPGNKWKNSWKAGTYYSLGDVVYYKGDSYTCNFEHEAEANTFPGDNGSGYEYWDLFIQGGQPGSLNDKGDIITYGANRELDGVADTSTLGNVRVPIGRSEQILSVSEDLEVFWRDITVDADVIYVAKNGIDDFNRGTFEKPFRSVRYACEYVEDNFAPLTPVVVKVGTGKYEEVGPIVVPAGCAIHGDELRSTTIFASPAIPEYQNDFRFVPPYVTHIETILLGVLSGTEVTPQEGNTVSQVVTSTVEARDELGNLITDINGNPILIPGYPSSDLDGAGAITSLFVDYQNYIDFVVQSGDTLPAITASNVPNTDANITNAAKALMLNADFIMADVVAFLNNTYPTETFNENRVRNDVYALLRGVKRDLNYSGNYGTITAAKRYSSAAIGSERENLFLMRDTTGLRDCTTGGLEGILNPPGVFDLYQKPTGGALVSLDPGWGPDDERVWIKNRSPYIQGVTNTGFGCVGLKIDGALHTGGNKSMTANDFTQVLSDGIGAWVTNNARAELVSVFTYYCQIGYFAEDGGVIRSTNGNNSYGRYGSIADGSDDTETPQEVTVFNRNNEAQVSTAFAGGNTDQIFIFEYSNSGQEYTDADATIIGAGSNAQVEYDSSFRDNSIFEARLTRQLGDSGTKGGTGYLTRQGSAQETLGASSTIKLSTNDVTQDVSEILGMRLIITDGTGVGQYGIVNTFNFVTKEVEILRESDGLAGWDHVIPGYPLVTDLDLTTRYRIEPRLEVSHPGFETLSTNRLFANRTYVGLEHAYTREDFTNLSTASQVNFLDDNDNIVTVESIISAVALQLSGSFATSPNAPFKIKGLTSGAIATVNAVSANTGSIIEVDISGTGNSFFIGEELVLVLVAGTGDTFDDDPIAATFDVTRIGLDYTVTLNSPGAGYAVNDVITISGTLLNGTTPENDITITVTSVTDDSAASVQTFTSTGTGKPKRFIALTNAEYAQYSDNGTLWNEVSLPYIGDYRALIVSDQGRIMALANATNQYSYTLDGAVWNIGTLPLSASWKDGTYGNGKFVVVADDINEIYMSDDGITWTSEDVGDDTGGDFSSISQWSHIVYGKGIFLAVSANDRSTATSTDGGTTWTRNDEALPDLAPASDWAIVDVAYGDNRFIVLDSAGRSAYSFDGVTWYQGTTAPGSLTYTKMKFNNGVFFALALAGTDATSACATTEDGIIWTVRNTSTAKRWGELTYANLNSVGSWVLLGNASQTDSIEVIRTGKQAKFRSEVSQGRFESIKIWDPGSGYTSEPTITVTDPNEETNIAPQSRIGNGVLAQPGFVNRGTGYRTSTSIINITGDGYADIIPEENTITLAGVTNIPGPGVQVRFETVFDLDTLEDQTDLKVFSGVTVTDKGDDGSGNGTRLIELKISPALLTEYDLVHNTNVTLRERYSQCRITGHDFLDIGTGNFEQTNYPEVYASGNYFVALPENEVYEANGGRVFYTSSDQDGNFRTGELFSVQQSTGIVTVSAEFFELDGLSELALGGVRLGGSGTVVNEFSTDPTFIADSNNIIPTQRAIATFLANRLSVGGENIEVNRLVAGRVGIGGFDNSIENTTGEHLIIPVDVQIGGIYTDENEAEQPVEIQGTIVSQMLFLKQFDDQMQ
jgi:hypothetical protein